MRPILWVDPQSCHTCPRCRARTSCRIKAIVQLEPGELPFIESERCLACQACVPACPFGAIDRREVAVDRAP
ncbi:MAG TPA: 4Fe-4S binding protein [Anaerolineae bacterium]